MKRAAFVVIVLVVEAAHAKPFNFESKTRYAEVDFAYPPEASAIPALVRRFKADLAKERTDTVKCGKLESEARIATGSQGIACTTSTKITTSGQTPRLLSLRRLSWEFTGGAHGNGGTTGILWDRRLAKEISFAALFRSAPAYVAALRPAYCRGLDAERKKRRGDDYGASSVPEFMACPPFSDLAMIPTASRSRVPFDRIHLIAAPYTAGSFAEGEYDIALPVTPRLIAALKPEYRSSFEAQRQ